MELREAAREDRLVEERHRLPPISRLREGELEDGYARKNGGPLRDDGPFLNELGEACNVDELCFE